MTHLKSIFSAMLMLSGVAVSYADINIAMENGGGKNLTILQQSLSSVTELPADTVTITLDANGKGLFKQASQPSVVTIMDGSRNMMKRVYTSGPSEQIDVVMDAAGNGVASGTALMEGIEMCNGRLQPVMTRAEEVFKMFDTDPVEAEELYEKLQKEFDTVLTDFISSNADSPAAVYALMQMNGETFLTNFDKLTPAARKSILMPIVEKQKVAVETRVAAERKLAALENGTTPAPAFTLPDLAGKQVSLSDFKGKWVVIDFWGSWCRWCVKGFPELKELSAKYGDKLAIIGVDCRDSKERWKDAVAKYELTWTNLYNECEGESNPLLEAYAVQGFPTKVIVDPQGIIRKIVVGADPKFPNTLSELMGE